MTTEKDLASLFAPQPSEKQKALWDAFVEEYIKDWDAIKAAMRVGFTLTYAQEYAKVFFSEPYVQRAISKFEMSLPTDDENITLRYKQQIEQTLLKAMASGDPKASVTAAMGLAKIRGLDVAPDKSGDELEKLVNGFKEIAKALPD